MEYAIEAMFSQTELYLKSAQQHSVTSGIFSRFEQQRLPHTLSNRVLGMFNVEVLTQSQVVGKVSQRL